MAKIMGIIAKNTHGISYNTEKYVINSDDMSLFEYDNDEEIVIKWQEHAETNRYKTYIDLRRDMELSFDDNPIVTYFLDGSRHVYKVDDISYNRKVFPVMAGQVGIGCCKRVDGLMKSEKHYSRYVIALPKEANADGWKDEAFFGAQTEYINQSPELKKYGIRFDRVLPYSVPADKRKGKAEASGVIVIQDYMIDAEKEMVSELVKAGKLNQNNYLLKDGSLEYKKIQTGYYSKNDLARIKHNYRFVIGVSKSFNPVSILDQKGKPNANYIVQLPMFHRTPVALYENPKFLGDVKFGVWYIRIRDIKNTRTPFDGVVKVEKILIDDEIENGLDSDQVNIISANILNERNPTCYGSDRRWANHLYPVYLTESYVKSKYMSEELFMHLF